MVGGRPVETVPGVAAQIPKNLVQAEISLQDRCIVNLVGLRGSLSSTKCKFIGLSQMSRAFVGGTFFELRSLTNSF